MKFKQWIRNFLRRTGAFILVTVLALISLSFIAHIPAVQKFGIHHITIILSNIAGTKVTVDRFSFNFFNSLEFDKLYVEDPGTPGDTLLFADAVDVRFANLITLAKGRINLRSIALDGVDLEFARSDSAKVSSLTSVINRFSSGETEAKQESGERKASTFRLRAGRLTGTDMRVKYYDDHKNTIQEYYLERAAFDFNKIIPDSNIIRLYRADVDGLTVSIRQWAQPDVDIPKDDSLRGKPLRIEVAEFSVNNSSVRVLNESRGDTTLVGGMNFDNLKVDSIHILVENFAMQELNFEGVVREMSFREHAGFELTNLRADYVSVSDTGVVLNGLDLLTPSSHLTDTLRLEYAQYTDFKDFVNSVYLFGNFNNSVLAVSDLLTIVPELRNSAFFAYNEDKSFRLSGVISGNVNRLRASNVSGRLGDLVFEGDFRSRNLTVKGEQFLNLRLNRAVTSVPILRQVLPNFNLPSQYNSLGSIVFSGRFDGFFNDFVADGVVTTDLGSASLDMRLDITKGVKLAEYSGGIALDSFDIGTWSENPDLGRVTASAQIITGRGLTSETANAELQGRVSSLSFKGYTYRNAVLSGLLDENYFSGNLEIKDENIDMNFNGTVDMRGENPEFDFLTTIDSVDLFALNILKDTFFMAGKFEVAGIITQSRGIDGFATASNVHIERGAAEIYDLDTIGLVSQPEGDVNHYRVTSDYINGRVDGDFQLASVIPQMKRYFGTHYPALFDSLNTLTDTIRSSPAELVYDLTLSKPEAWSGIFNIKDLGFDELTIYGKLDFLHDSLTAHVSSPRVRQGNLTGQSLKADVVFTEEFYEVSVTSDSFFVGNMAIQGVAIAAQGDDEAMSWDLGLESLFDTMAVDLGGTFTYDSTGNYAINIAHKQALFFDPAWELNLGNRIAWGPGFIEVDSFYLRNGEHFIEIADIDRRGVLVDVENFDLSYLNDLWEYDKLDFSGVYSLDLRIEDIYNRDQINLLFDMDQLVINEDSFGVFSTRVTAQGPGNPLIVNSFLGDESAPILKLEGSYDPVTVRGFNVDLRATLSDFPGWFLEYFLNNSISRTRGTVTGVITLKGDSTALALRGSAWARGAATTVNVTGVRYRFNDFEVKLTNDFIDLSNAVLADMSANTAEVSGGLRHNMMKDMELDVRVRSDRITGIDLQKSEDVVFYGTGIGAADVRFTGLTSDPSILVNATTGQGTRIYMPLDEGGSVDEESYLRFIERDSLGNIITTTRVVERSGINLEVNLTVTDDAQVDLIFNEYTRDILRGVSEGDIQINLNRSGDLTLFGDVEVVSGNYLFTSRGVNKPFNIRPGGTIVWNGDPYEAELNIVADYAGLRTSVSPLIEEYLVNASLNAQQEARQLTKVQLELILTGPLSSPEINFDIKFPDLTGEISGYLDNKLKTLQSDPNALNQQAFGLIIFGTFLPANDVAGVNSGNLAGVGIANTLSEFISSQLSYYISEFLQGAIEDVGFISGIDFDVGYNRSYDFITQNAAVEEWEVHMRNRLFNDRFVVDVGGSYVTDNPWTSRTYFAGDYALEYALTEDRRLKVRLYYRNDETIEGRKNKTGIGLSYRREFDNFGDWLKGLESDAKKLAEDGSREGEQKEPN